MSMDVQVKEAVLHVAALKLRRVVRFQLAQSLAVPIGHKMRWVLAQVFSGAYREAVTPVITILHKLELKRILHVFPELAGDQANRLCRQYTRQFVRNLIKKEQRCNRGLDMGENGFQTEQDQFERHNIALEGKSELQNQALRKTPKTLQIIPSMNVKIENTNADGEMDQLSAVSVTQKGSLPETKTEYQSERGNLKAESSHSQVQQSPASTVAICERENDSHAVEQSERYGHFDYGDELDQIQQVFLVQKEIFGVVSWKPRFEGFTPEQSTLSVRYIRKYAPLQLSEFYAVFLHRIERRKRFFKAF